MIAGEFDGYCERALKEEVRSLDFSRDRYSLNQWKVEPIEQRSANPGPRANFGPRRIFEGPHGGVDNKKFAQFSRLSIGDPDVEIRVEPLC